MSEVIFNKVFPEWIMANTVLDEMIDEYFEVRVLGHANAIDVRLLPLWCMSAVPIEYREKAYQIVSEFHDKLYALPEVRGALDQFLFEPNTANIRTRIKHAVENVLEQYEKERYYLLSHELKGLLGIPPYDIQNGIALMD